MPNAHCSIRALCAGGDDGALALAFVEAVLKRLHDTGVTTTRVIKKDVSFGNQIALQW